MTDFALHCIVRCWVRTQDCGNIFLFVHTKHLTLFFCTYFIQNWFICRPSLRFHCIGGCWDRTQDCCNICICGQTLLLDLIHNSAKSHSPTNFTCEVKLSSGFCPVRCPIVPVHIWNMDRRDDISLVLIHPGERSYQCPPMEDMKCSIVWVLLRYIALCPGHFIVPGGAGDGGGGGG
jgi:hypothetical protein